MRPLNIIVCLLVTAALCASCGIPVRAELVNPEAADGLPAPLVTSNDRQAPKAVPQSTGLGDFLSAAAPILSVLGVGALTHLHGQQTGRKQAKAEAKADAGTVAVARQLPAAAA